MGARGPNRRSRASNPCSRRPSGQGGFMRIGRMQTSSLAILAAVASSSLAQWEPSSRQINSGVYTLLASDGALYAGTDGDGAFGSSDRGGTWNTLNAGFPERQGVYTFAEFGGRLFAGTYNGVYYSTDQGLNWTRSNHENWKVFNVLGLAGN